MAFARARALCYVEGCEGKSEDRFHVVEVLQPAVGKEAVAMWKARWVTGGDDIAFDVVVP
jgi:hypothetical protein